MWQGYLGYCLELLPIVREGIRHDWRRLVPYPCELSDPCAWGNLLAFRDPIDESVLAGAIGKLAKVVEMSTGQDRNSPVLATDRRYRLVVGPDFKRVSSNIWRYHHADRKSTRLNSSH